MVSFAVQKLLSLIRFHLFIFAFISIALGDRSKKVLVWLCQRMFCLYSLLEVFTVSCLVFKSLSHFEFIFVYSVRVCSNFIGLLVALQLSQHHLEKCFFFFFPFVYSYLLCWRLIGCRCVALFLYSILLIHMSVFVPIPCYSDTVAL